MAGVDGELTRGTGRMRRDTRARCGERRQRRGTGDARSTADAPDQRCGPVLGPTPDLAPAPRPGCAACSRDQVERLGRRRWCRGGHRRRDPHRLPATSRPCARRLRPRCAAPVDPSDAARALRGRPPAAARLLASSKRPVFAFGVGALGAVRSLPRNLLDGAPWPVLTTYRAKGPIPERWEQAAGLLTGATIEAPLLASADLIIAVGLDPVELIPAPWPYRGASSRSASGPSEVRTSSRRSKLVGRLEELLGVVSRHLPRRAGPTDARTRRSSPTSATRTDSRGWRRMPSSMRCARERLSERSQRSTRARTCWSRCRCGRSESRTRR